MRLLIFLLLGVSVGAFAQTTQDLTQANAFPDEIIRQLDRASEKEPAVNPAPAPVVAQVGTVVSLIKKGGKLYQFSVSLSNDTVVQVVQENSWGLAPGMMVILHPTDTGWKIERKLPD